MWTLSLAISALIISAVSLIIGGLGLCFVIGLKNSTHKVQYIPIDPNDATNPKELEKLLNGEGKEFEEDQF